MAEHAKATCLEREIGSQRGKNIGIGSRNRSRSSGLTAMLAVARLFSALPTIIESTKKHCDESEGGAVAYFYFSFTDTAKQQCYNMLSSVLEQLAAQVDITPDCLVSLHHTYQRSKPPTEPLHTPLFCLVLTDISINISPYSSIRFKEAFI
jgi:hypothetical protein